MKKILPWLLLLVLLIIFCVWSKKDTIHLSSAETQKVTAPVVVKEHDIEYVITQQDDTEYTLSGTFNNAQQHMLFTNAFQKEHKHLSNNTITLDKSSKDKGIIALTTTILPHFIKAYKDGKLVYHNKKLTLSGVAQTKQLQQQMAQLLQNTTINFEDNSTVAITKEQLEQEKKELKQEITHLLEVENIEFDHNQSSLTPKGKVAVDHLANILKKYSDVRVEIAGHTDSDGNEQYNLKLSQERVDTIKKELLAQGIKGSRIETKGYGETKPLVPNTTPENKAKNRRVEINILGE